MWHKTSEELPEVGQMVIIKDVHKCYGIRIYHPSISDSIEFWTEFPTNGWKQTKDFKETFCKYLVLASNVIGYFVEKDVFFSKCNDDISSGYRLFTEYQYLPLIDE